MVRFLVIKGKLVPITDILFMIFTFIGTIVFFIAWLYMYFNNTCTNSQILIKSTSRLPLDYQDKIKYYYIYDKIDFKFLNQSYSLKNDMFSKIKVNNGRYIINDYEVIISDDKSYLLNKKILLNINNSLHEFLVVGMYDAKNVIDEKNIYVSGSTLESLYNYTFDEYYYIFISDEYPLLNEDLDFFTLLGHEVEIITTNMFDDFFAYRVMKDTFLVTSTMLVLMFGIYVFDIYFLE